MDIKLYLRCVLKLTYPSFLIWFSFHFTLFQFRFFVFGWFAAVQAFTSIKSFTQAISKKEGVPEVVESRLVTMASLKKPIASIKAVSTATLKDTTIDLSQRRLSNHERQSYKTLTSNTEFKAYNTLSNIGSGSHRTLSKSKEKLSNDDEQIDSFRSIAHSKFSDLALPSTSPVVTHKVPCEITEMSQAASLSSDKQFRPQLSSSAMALLPVSKSSIASIEHQSLLQRSQDQLMQHPLASKRVPNNTSLPQTLMNSTEKSLSFTNSNLSVTAEGPDKDNYSNKKFSANDQLENDLLEADYSGSLSIGSYGDQQSIAVFPAAIWEFDCSC
ncbi:hypothetical protein PoB_006246200 [Plakobranchus ocellatus]|uniref:Uncharacterized protein n=1 Tax=Plakobranchus ocellatus TaxID=259542 RepID=A0AAV4CVM3_9GAST|nr:hypothetical protein PoB_006246200 [Plakobranchus ocellatus]